jgi:hypothetical protein
MLVGYRYGYTTVAACGRCLPTQLQGRDPVYAVLSKLCLLSATCYVCVDQGGLLKCSVS